MIRSLPSVPISIKTTPTAVSRVAAQDDRELPRQGSLADGEGIKIVIHDVDSDHGMFDTFNLNNSLKNFGYFKYLSHVIRIVFLIGIF